MYNLQERVECLVPELHEQIFVPRNNFKIFEGKTIGIPSLDEKP